MLLDDRAMLDRVRALSAPGRGAALGGLTMAAVLLLRLGILPLYPPDALLWVLWLILVAVAAGLGAGLGLAWRHVSAAPGVLGRAGIFLVPLTLWMLWSHESRRRDVPRMLAGADSSRSVVLGENVLGKLIVVGQYPDGAGRLIAPWKREHARFSPGDTIVIYFERKAPHRLLDVAPAGPEILVTMHRLFWLWLIGSALLAGYGPLVSRWLGKPLRRTHPLPAAERGAAGDVRPGVAPE